MEDKKYQVFVSSTYKDLLDARTRIIEVVLSLYHFPVGMEMFSADDAEQWEIIKETIDVSDYYVVVIGHRYGSVDADGMSFTEKEYDYAKQRGIPVLAFVRDRGVATRADERESDASSAEKLEIFIRKATSSKMCDFWTDVDVLATKVAIALPKAFRRSPRTGWVRGTEAVSKEISQELAALSMENRDLRMKVTQLEGMLHQSEPDIKVDVDAPGSEESCLCLRVSREEVSAVSIPAPLKMSDVSDHLAQYIDEADLDKYNAALPTENEMAAYREDLEFYLRATKSAIRPSITVRNDGTAKATDVIVTLEFPEGVAVLTDDDISSLELPKNPIPISPIQKAESKHKERSPLISSFGSMVALPFTTPNFVLNDLLSGFTALNRNAEISVEANVVTILIASLMQTRQQSFDSAVNLVPLTRGRGVIAVKVICEQYREERFFEIPATIE